MSGFQIGGTGELTFALGSRAASLGYRLLAFPEAGSTNAEAMARIRDGERGPLWLVTGHQTAGRGRRHRSWTSPPGNLAATVVEVLSVTPSVAATLGFAAGLALTEALAMLQISSQLKWPNDVLVDGAKLSGILLEAEPAGDNQIAVIVGIGVNVVSAPQGMPYRAVSLRELGCSVSAETVFAALTDSWADFRQLWADGSGMASLRQLWLARAEGLGSTVTINLGSRTVSGVFETIDEHGQLILAGTDGNRLTVSSGDVFFGDAASGAAGAA